MIGSNDSWVEPNNNGPQAMAQRLGALMDKIINAKPNALLAVALITPRNDYAKDWANSYNAVIPGLCRSASTKALMSFWWTYIKIPE